MGGGVVLAVTTAKNRGIVGRKLGWFQMVGSSHGSKVTNEQSWVDVKWLRWFQRNV